MKWSSHCKDPCHFSVGNIKFRLFYFKLKFEHWKIIAQWFLIWDLDYLSRDVCIFCQRVILRCHYGDCHGSV